MIFVNIGVPQDTVSGLLYYSQKIYTRNQMPMNKLNFSSEMEVFMSAVRWLKYDWSARDRYKYEILDCVRFGNIAPWQLVDIKRNPENPDFMELAKDPRICKMIDDGLA